MKKQEFFENSDSTRENSLYFLPLGNAIRNKMLALPGRPPAPSPLSYLSSFMVVLAVVIFQYSLFPEPAVAPFVLFFPAAYLVSFRAGLKPGLLAVALSALAGNFFFMAPYWAWSLSFQALMATFLFIASSGILVLFSLYFRKILVDYNQVASERKNAEAEFRLSNEEWNIAFDAISDLTFIQDKNFKIVKVNRSFAKIIKLKPEEIIGKKCYEVLHKSGKPWHSCPFEKTRIDRRSHTEEVFDPGIGLPLLVTTSPIFNKTGEFLGSIHIAKDISEQKRAEKALLKSEERMQRAQQIAHLGSWELDLVNNKLTWSDEVYRIFGLKRRGFEATYEAFLEAVHPDDRAKVDAAYSQSLKQGKDNYEIEHRVIRKSNGEIRVVYEKCQHVRDESGKVIRSVGMIHDITERKQIEDSLRLQMIKDEALLASIGDGVVAIGMLGEILFANQAFADLIKKSRNDLLGKNLNKAVSLLDEKGLKLSDGLRPTQRTLKTGREVKSSMIRPIYYEHPVKGLTALSITATPIILNNKTIGAISVYRDISRDIAIDQAKTEFVSLASHQLRTPLSSIALSTELLLRGAAGEITPEQKKYLKEAYNSTKVMAGLIKVLLDISRLELGTYVVRLEPINLAENIDYLIDELKLQFDSKKLILRKNYKVFPVIKFDKNILRTTIENLLTNAIRYTAAGGTIVVSLEKNDKEIIIKIADTGCGIPEKDKSKVFEKLFRSENAKLISTEGTGLGLYLVKSSLDQINSRVWFESELGKGTTFFVAIPLD